MIRLRRAITILVAALVSLLALSPVSATALAETGNSAGLLVDEWIAPTSTTHPADAHIVAFGGYNASLHLSRSRTAADEPRRAAKARPTVNWDGQAKHFPGHNSYAQGKSQLSADPRKLVEKAGTGQPAGSVARGQPGFRERVDFGEQIGIYIDPVTGAELPTTRGILHYSKKGAHIVPARPG